MIYTIENDVLSLSVNGDGGSMTSLVYKPTGEERLWQGDEKWWKGQDVVIFPIVGHAGGFTAKGKSCALRSHGIIRYVALELRKKSDHSLTLGFRSDSATHENYPYEFDFEISYELYNNSVRVSYFVRSLSGKMPFYVGGHPGMKAPGGRARIEFEREEQPLCYPLDSDVAVPVGKVKGFTLDKAFFAEHKTYQLGSLSGGAIYAFTDDGYRYAYKSDCPLFAFWSNEKGGDYVCVEPWWGTNDYPSAPREITLKPFMNFDDGTGKRFSYTLSVEKL